LILDPDARAREARTVAEHSPSIRRTVDDHSRMFASKLNVPTGLRAGGRVCEVFAQAPEVGAHHPNFI
jgi:hypothetical protein